MTCPSDPIVVHSQDEARQKLRHGPMLRGLPEHLKDDAVERAMRNPHRYGIVISEADDGGHRDGDEDIPF